MESRIYFVLDRSGSMIADDVKKGFNSFLKHQDPNALMTLHVFDHEFSTVYRDVPVKDVEPLKYRPRGGTALLDAIMKAIKDTDETLPRLWSDQEDVSVTFVILTDGEDNSSHENTLDDTHYSVTFKKLIGWRFLFLGASEKTFEIADKIGFDRGDTLFYDTQKIDVAMEIAGKVIRRETSFTEDERSLSY